MTTNPAARLLSRLGRDTLYVFLGLPLAVLSFSLLITGLSLGVGLAVTLLGLPVAAATLGLAVLIAQVERARLAGLGEPVAPLELAAVRPGLVRGVLDRLADPRRWAAALHGIGVLPVAVLTWSVVVTWWAVGLGGVTAWFWMRFLPEDSGDQDVTLPELIGIEMNESLFYFLLGLVFLATLVPVVRGAALLQASWARLLLTGSSRRALRAQVAELSSQREAAAAAETASLRRLERDIHDGPQQRLVRLAMDLSGAERSLETDPEASRRLLVAAREQAAETLAELRSLSRGIAPPVLADRGLLAAVSAVAARSTVPVTVASELGDDSRPGEAAETAAYFVVCEALANVAKHAQAQTATVALRRPVAQVDGRADGTDELVVAVSDDGVGGAGLAKGHGLRGLEDRVHGLGGRLEVTSGSGGTTVTAHLPWS